MRVQTYLRRQTYEKFKRYMEKRHLTFYRASAELIEKGLENPEKGKEVMKLSTKEESELTLMVKRLPKVESFLKEAISKNSRGKTLSHYQAVQKLILEDLILRGLMDFEREKANPHNPI